MAQGFVSLHPGTNSDVLPTFKKSLQQLFFSSFKPGHRLNHSVDENVSPDVGVETISHQGRKLLHSSAIRSLTLAMLLPAVFILWGI